MQEQETDLELITAVLRGNSSTYAVLMKRHQRFVFTLALRFTKNREDAEEVAQDCFIKAYRSLGTFKQSSKFTTWLYTITYNCAMTALRKKRPDTFSLDDEEMGTPLTSFIAAANEDTIEKKSSHFYLNMAIDQLSPEDATIIILFYKAEQSLEEIAQALSMDSNKVKVKLHRARIKLKEKLQYLLKEEVKEML